MCFEENNVGVGVKNDRNQSSRNVLIQAEVCYTDLAVASQTPRGKNIGTLPKWGNHLRYIL
jgi:hypothetical protein